MTPTRALVGLAAVAAAGYVVIHSMGGQGPQYVGDFPSIQEQSQTEPRRRSPTMPGAPQPGDPHALRRPAGHPEAARGAPAGPAGPGPVPPAAASRRRRHGRRGRVPAGVQPAQWWADPADRSSGRPGRRPAHLGRAGLLSPHHRPGRRTALRPDPGTAHHHPRGALTPTVTQKGPGRLTGASPRGVSDGARTRDTQDHNLVLYQLSYTHHVPARRARRRGTGVTIPEPVGRPVRAGGACVTPSRRRPRRGWRRRQRAARRRSR